MAITNRSLDVTEQKEVIQASYAAVATGATLLNAVVPYPCTLTDIRVAAIGLSGSPTYTFYVGREYIGAGFSAQAVTGALTAQAVGTSGIQRASLLAAGSTLLNLQAGDVVFAVSGAANTAVTGLAIALVAQATQEIKSYFNVIS